MMSFSAAGHRGVNRCRPIHRVRLYDVRDPQQDRSYGSRRIVPVGRENRSMGLVPKIWAGWEAL